MKNYITDEAVEEIEQEIRRIFYPGNELLASQIHEMLLWTFLPDVKRIVHDMTVRGELIKETLQCSEGMRVHVRRAEGKG